MELQNLCSESLAKLTIGIIEKIEQDLRDFAQHFTEEAAAGGKALEKLKHVFMIRGLNGKVYKVKKSTMLWNLSSGRLRRSNDRLRRFHRIRMDPNSSSRVKHNVRKHEISVGDWVILQNKICHVSIFLC